MWLNVLSIALACSTVLYKGNAAVISPLINNEYVYPVLANQKSDEFAPKTKLNESHETYLIDDKKSKPVDFLSLEYLSKVINTNSDKQMFYLDDVSHRSLGRKGFHVDWANTQKATASDVIYSCPVPISQQCEYDLALYGPATKDTLLIGESGATCFKHPMIDFGRKSSTRIAVISYRGTEKVEVKGQSVLNHLTKIERPLETTGLLKLYTEAKAILKHGQHLDSTVEGWFEGFNATVNGLNWRNSPKVNKLILTGVVETNMSKIPKKDRGYLYDCLIKRNATACAPVDFVGQRFVAQKLQMVMMVGNGTLGDFTRLLMDQMNKATKGEIQKRVELIFAPVDVRYCRKKGTRRVNNAVAKLDCQICQQKN